VRNLALLGRIESRGAYFRLDHPGTATRTGAW